LLCTSVPQILGVYDYVMKVVVSLLRFRAPAA
jgi:hypothetical protein